jgi:hypothetical protein
MPATELLYLALGTGPLPERAIAFWYVLCTNPRTCKMRERRAEPQLAFDGMHRPGLPGSLVTTASNAFRKLRDPLCAAILLLQPHRSEESASIADDPFVPEALIDGVPSWAYDVHTREGRAALQRFLQGTTDTALWVRPHISTDKRVKFLGSVVFRIERRTDAVPPLLADWRQPSRARRSRLRRTARRCSGDSQVMRCDLPALNEARAEVGTDVG